MPDDRDKVIADTGWGIKPDDQPANAGEAAGRASNLYRYDPNEPDAVRAILKAQRKGFNTANSVIVSAERFIILDLNGDGFTVEGLGYGCPHLVELMNELGAAFSPQQLRAVPAGDPVKREYKLTRAWAWGSERSG
ncbi:MAG: hypothetical protein WD768_21675 [Phycisphaeraceae bacterium]